MDLVALINTYIQTQKPYMQNADTIIDVIQYVQKTLIFQLFIVQFTQRKH